MNFDSAVEYMQALHRFGIKLGNERFEALLERIGDPHRGYGIAHVTGTKGKGSTTVMIAAILQAHGFRTGSYFSPYVYDLTERVQVDAVPIPRDDFARIVSEIEPSVESLAETDHGQTTEFELKTAVGFKYFSERKVDFAVVEVGIGGRLDATNVVHPLVSVITNVGLDHTHILGDTLDKIAFEKAGIIKRGVPCITAADSPESLRVIREIAAGRDAPLRVVAEAPCSAADVTWNRTEAGVSVRTQRAVLQDIELRLRGRFQGANAACAIAAAEDLALQRGFELKEGSIREGLRRAYVPGRFEIIRRRPLVIVDGAHNGLAARMLAAELAGIPYRRLLLVVGMIGGHSPDDVLKELGPLAHTVYATEPAWSRRIPVEQVSFAARKYCTDVKKRVPPLQAAIEALEQAEPDDLVLITGSFYVVGDVPPAKLLEYGHAGEPGRPGERHTGR